MYDWHLLYFLSIINAQKHLHGRRYNWRSVDFKKFRSCQLAICWIDKRTSSVVVLYELRGTSFACSWWPVGLRTMLSYRRTQFGVPRTCESELNAASSIEFYKKVKNDHFLNFYRGNPLSIFSKGKSFEHFWPPGVKNDHFLKFHRGNP